MAVTTIGNQIKSGQIDIGLAVGVESLSSKCVLANEVPVVMPLG